MIWLKSILECIFVAVGLAAIFQPNWLIKMWKIPTATEKAKMQGTGWTILGAAAFIALLDLWP